MKRVMVVIDGAESGLCLGAELAEGRIVSLSYGDLDQLRALHAAMLATHKAYIKSPPDEVHIAHAEYKAARFRYNVACGEYVAGLLEGGK